MCMHSKAKERHSIPGTDNAVTSSGLFQIMKLNYVLITNEILWLKSGVSVKGREPWNCLVWS